MAETHQLHDSWYEIWFGPEDNRRHLKRLDEASVDTEIDTLRAQETASAAQEKRDEVDLNFEVTKVTVNRESVDAKPAVPASGIETNGGHATVHAPNVATTQGTTLPQ